jgi:hypothetical protein
MTKPHFQEQLSPAVRPGRAKLTELGKHFLAAVSKLAFRSQIFFCCVLPNGNPC